MFSTHHFHKLFCFALLWCAGITGASAQWLVYELRFSPEEDSVNFSFYTGAYLIAPAQGGPATMILTTEEGGRFYAVAEGGGKFFMAANALARKAVFSAAALTGTSQAFYSASGWLNRSLLLGSPSGARSWRVAETLSGRLMAADDESETGPAADGSVGMTGSALITGILREDLTANATGNFTTHSGAVNYIVELLEKYGYEPDSSQNTSSQEQTVEEVSVIDASLFPVETQGRSPTKD